MSDIKEAALAYHRHPQPGKTSVEITKPTATQKDLSLAYSPGVAEPVRAIADNIDAAYDYTNKGNLVGVISDGSAILGLGNLGALPSKPVMEGKAVLFKRFAGIDVFDIEVNAKNIEAFCETVINVSPTFGGINLEDIKAPECFEVERIVAEQCDIPIFHDDQHGTAITIAAGLMNALELQKKSLETSQIVCVGAGAAGIASMRLLLEMGARKENLYLLDTKGVIHTERKDLNKYKAEFANDTSKRTLADAMDGADIFIGCSSADLLDAQLLLAMNDNPIVFALANPDPEIKPELALEIRKDIIVATGRSDYPNQVNNVLGFPFIFRGALDVRATCINEAMKLAAVDAIRLITKESVPQEVVDAYGGQALTFGPEYIIPKPSDPRLINFVSAAVARAAVDSGVARLPYPNHYPLENVSQVHNKK